MKKVFLFLFIGFLIIALVHFPSQASGSNSELLMKQDGQTIYLTTQESATSSGNGVVTNSTIITTNTATSSVSGSLIYPPTGFAKDFGSLVNFALQVIMVIALLLVFAFLIMGGIQWITSGGDKAKTEAARNKIIAAIVGLIILASSYAILLLILHFFGFSDLNSAINNVGTIYTQTPIATSSSQLRQQNLVQ